MSRKYDILVEIPDEDLPSLVPFYEKYIAWAPHIVSVIHSGISWKRNKNFRHHFTFFSVENASERDGTIIILETNFCYNISVFTSDETGTSLYRGLTETKLLNYETENAVFFCVHEKHIPIIRRAMDHLKLKVTQSAYSMYALPPHLGLQRALKEPKGIYFRKLGPESAGRIASLWSCQFKDSGKYVKGLVELNGGFGAFLESTDEMVAWGLRYSSGHIGVLRTEEAWKRRGFGGLVARILADEIVKEGFWPFASVAAENLASLRLFEKLGFRKIAGCAYVTLEN